MFPPMTTGYEERDGSIGEQSFNFYKRLAQGDVAYIVLGDVAPTILKMMGIEQPKAMTRFPLI